MSRNFELLERLNSERRGTASDYQAEPDPAAPTVPRPNLETRTYAELNKLVQRLFLSGPAASRRIVFTGIAPGVGCTCVTVHTAEVLCSQTTGVVCLVETNKSSSALREHFSLPDGAGFTDTLAQDGPVHSFARRVRSNLWVVTAGTNSANGPVLFRPRLEACLLQLGDQFDYILLDTAPVVVGSSSLTLGTLADGVVLVLKAGHTRRPAVHLAITELEGAGVKVLGTVLNQRDYPIPDAIYKRI